MITSQALRNIVDGLLELTKKDIRVVERDGRHIAGLRPIEEEYDAASHTESFVLSAAETQTLDGFQFFKVFDNGVVEYVVIIRGVDEETYQIGRLAAFQIKSVIEAYKERYDRDNFIKNLLLDNLLLMDIYNRAKQLQIENNARRVVYLVKVEDKDELALEVARNIFPSRQRDFVTPLGESSIAIVKELGKESSADIEQYARIINGAIETDALSRNIVAIGRVASDLRLVSGSYKEALMALKVGAIFSADKNVINFEKLGVGRLIFQLPISICKMFVEEALRGLRLDELDEGVEEIVLKLFENNLNISETARQLFIHRNTLVYKLERVQRATGLDLRSFEHSLVFKLAMMVSEYLSLKTKL